MESTRPANTAKDKEKPWMKPHALKHRPHPVYTVTVNDNNFRPQVREWRKLDLYDMQDALPFRCNQACVFLPCLLACVHGRHVETSSPENNQTRSSYTSKTTSKYLHFISVSTCIAAPVRERPACTQDENCVNAGQFVPLKRFLPLCWMTEILSAWLQRLCDLTFPMLCAGMKLLINTYRQACIIRAEQSCSECQSMTHTPHTQISLKGFYAAVLSFRDQLTNYTQNIHL